LSQKLAILKKAFGNYWSNGSEHLFHCPKCKHHKRKLSVNIEKNCFKCWVCDYSGKKISKLLKFYSSEHYNAWRQEDNSLDLEKYDLIFESKEEVVVKAPLGLPKEFQTLTGTQKKAQIEPLSYLKDRGLSKLDILKWKVGFCNTGEYAKRIVIPSFDRYGYLNYFIARSYRDDWAKYKNPKVNKDIIFNDINIDWQSDVVLVEGVFDAMKCDNAIPILGSTLRENSKLFQKICRKRPKVYLALDADAREKQLLVAKRLKEHGLVVRSVNIHPYLDVGDMPHSEFENRKQKASVVSEMDYLQYKLDF